MVFTSWSIMIQLELGIEIPADYIKKWFILCKQG